jgi:phage terminase large subunit GpA-like protein
VTLDWQEEARTILSVLQPRPRLTISQWADRERKLSPEASSEPGQWHTARAEYLREIMDAIGDPRVHTVVVMSSAQVGKTEALLNAIGYFIDYDPSPILLVEPTLDMADALSKDRLAAMLRDTPALRGKVRDARARDSGNTLLHKQFPGGHITLCGSNSPASLASRPIRVVLCDEVDRYEASAGAEGDPVALAAKRSTTFWNRRLVMVSTPTLKGLSRIEAAYGESDQRQFEVACPDCNEYQALRWAQASWDKDQDANGKTIAHHPETAHYVCEHCGSIWTDVMRWGAVRGGRWRAAKPFNGVAGFHLNEIYSSWVPLERMVREFLGALGDSARQQAFTNMSLGETWEPPYETKVEGHELLARGENYSPNALPDGIQDLTAGTDTHPDRLEVSLYGFSRFEECWAVDHIIIRGDPAQQNIWVAFDKLLLSRFRTMSGRELRIVACCIDSGGHHAQQVTNFASTRAARRVFATKGMAGPRRLWPLRSSRTHSGALIYLLGVDTGKDTIYSRLRISEPGPGYMHFPVGGAFDQDFFEQLTAERVVTRYRMGIPYRVWELPSGKRNEALDCAVLALAAYQSLGRRREAMVASPAPLIPGQPQPSPSPFPRPTPEAMQERAARLAKLLPH